MESSFSNKWVAVYHPFGVASQDVWLMRHYMIGDWFRLLSIFFSLLGGRLILLDAVAEDSLKSIRGFRFAPIKSSGMIGSLIPFFILATTASLRSSARV